MGDVAAIGADTTVGERPDAVPRTRLAAVAVALAGAAFLVFVAFVQHGWGQRLDEAMKAWWLPARNRVEGPARAVARLFAAPLGAVVLVVSTAIVLRRRRTDALPALFAIVLGGPALALLLKHEVLSREVLVDGTFPPSNTLPSGHGAVLATAAIVAVWLARLDVRPLALVLAAVAAAGGGVVILAAALHRPSDVMASFLVVAAWSAGVLAVGGRTEVKASSEPRPAGSWMTRRRALVAVASGAGLLLLIGVVLAGVAVVDARDADSTTLAVFAAGCALVAGVALLVVAVVGWALGDLGVGARALPSGSPQVRRA